MEKTRGLCTERRNMSLVGGGGKRQSPSTYYRMRIGGGIGGKGRGGRGEAFTASGWQKKLGLLYWRERKKTRGEREREKIKRPR